MGNNIVTGATGFVGSALVLELLSADSNSEIWCLARASTKQSARTRLFNSLQNMRTAYGLHGEFPQEFEDRIQVIEGDLVQEQCGISTQIAHQIPSSAYFWHCAASLNYEDRYQEEIKTINIGGTRHALSLARLLKVSHFRYLSTSYVAGTRLGLIPEELMDRTQQANNHYERSKIEAEWLVAEAQDLSPRIMRPSVVIGHSQTYAPANSYSGLYGFMRRIAKSIAIMERLDAHYLKEYALRLRCEPQAYLNLVPVDHVVRQAVAIGLQPTTASSPLVYHLTNANPILIERFLALLFTYLNLFPPLQAHDVSELNEIDQSFAKGIDFYNSYLLYPKTFDRKHTDAALNMAGQGDFELSDSVMQSYFDWYLEYLSRTDPKTITRAHLDSKVTVLAIK